MTSTPTEMAAVFERVRLAVFQEATRPSPYDAQLHRRNQECFASKLSDLCANARLRADMTSDELWSQLWTKIRYAGFRASYVTNEVPRLIPFFGNFRLLSGPEWRFDGMPQGEAVREFLGRTGRFAGISYSRLAPKLQKMLTLAALLRALDPGANAMSAIFGDGYDAPTDVAMWKAHERLAKHVGFTTALHIMTDLGFPCVKPDIWLVRLMSRLGWIEEIISSTATEAVITRDYQKPTVARFVISRAREIAKLIKPLHPEAPLREFDFVMVKYGQKPGEFGIERSLHEEWLPIQRIMEWKPSDEPVQAWAQTPLPLGGLI